MAKARYYIGENDFYDNTAGKLYPPHSLVDLDESEVPSRTWKPLNKAAQVALKKRTGKDLPLLSGAPEVGVDDTAPTPMGEANRAVRASDLSPV